MQNPSSDRSYPAGVVSVLLNPAGWLRQTRVGALIRRHKNRLLLCTCRGLLNGRVHIDDYISRPLSLQFCYDFLMKAVNTPSDSQKTGVQYVTIDSSHAGQRLDNFLLTALKGVPRTHVYRILRKGEVRVNKGRAKADYRLEEGDVVRLPPVRRGGSAGQEVAAKAVASGKFDWLNERVLYEDEHLLVLDKPAGLAVHGGSGVSVGLIEALRLLRPQNPFLELAHRLDRDTSGCLIVAKSRTALVRLHDLLRDGHLDKFYLALVRGHWQGGARSVDVALEKNRPAGGERRVEVGEEGKESASRFKPIEKFPDATLVEIHLLTGRMHQARVHAAHIGHPIAGDEKYGDPTFNQDMKELGLMRLFLHATRLDFRHPLSGRALLVTAPHPPELQRTLEQLRHRPEAISAT
jgi:23S rRNA pseudouridine955/2504/2580 synthase